MILIDALYINNGGGKRLLDLFVSELSKSNKDVFYLLDSRIKGEYNFLDKKNVTFLDASLIKRHIFYLNNIKKISCVFSFSNIPPTVRLKIPVYTYFHNYKLLFSGNYGLSFLKSIVIRLIKRNTSNWIVQSNFIKHELAKVWSINLEKILVLPFFDDHIVGFKCLTEIKYDNCALKFIYVSDGHHYKNHTNLISAFVKYSNMYPNSTLTLTVGENFVELIDKIDNARREGVKIINKGIISYDNVIKELIKSDIVIYPSTIESFGLGLIEAAQLGLPICAANLPYVYEVVIPNCTFDPFSIDSIYRSLIYSHGILGHSSKLVCENKLDSLIKIVSNE